MSHRGITLNIFVLTGDGLAAESGLASFRTIDGSWERFSPYHVESRKGFVQSSRDHRRFYDLRRRKAANVQPNAAHYALANLEERMIDRQGSVLIATQCLDDLQERTGSSGVVHTHGEYAKARCWSCKAFIRNNDLESDPGCPACGHADSAMQHVVCHGQTPLGSEEIECALEKADLFIAIGTSRSFQPPSSLIQQAWKKGIKTVEFNTDGSATSGLFHTRYIGAASETVPTWVNELYLDHT